jgi:hypothetical protein
MIRLVIETRADYLSPLPVHRNFFEMVRGQKNGKGSGRVFGNSS